MNPVLRRPRAACLATFLLASVAACGLTGVDDEFAVEETEEIDESKADSDGTYTYFQVDPDFRRCAAPACGGYYVKRLNRTTTKCADGTYQAECYVAAMDWAGLGLADESLPPIAASIYARSSVMRGVVRKRDFDGQEFGAFVPSEAWIGHGPGSVDGVFARIEPTGVRCFAEPCPSMREKKLNSSARAELAELGWDTAGVSEDDVGAAIEQLFGEGLIIAGDRFTVTGPGGTGKGRTVTRYFTRAVEVALPACTVGGCSNQLCTDEPGLITTCEWRDEYACYQTATCARQPDGACGWTPTAELDACLADPSSGSPE